MPNAAARTLVLSGTLDRRIAQIEALLPPAPAEDWYRVGDPAARIRSLLAAARGHSIARQYAAAVDLLAEAQRLVRDAEPALRAARLETEIELARAREARRRTRLAETLAKGRQKGAQARRRRARKKLGPLIPEARRLRSERGWSLLAIATHFQRNGKADLSPRQIVRRLREAGIR